MPPSRPPLGWPFWEVLIRSPYGRGLGERVTELLEAGYLRAMGQIFNMTNTDDDLGGLIADQGAPPLEDPIEDADLPRYDAHTALVIVDVQNDFAHPDGSLFVEGGPDVVAAVNTEVAAAKEAGAFVVYSQDWHPPATPHFVTDGGKWPVHCVRDTWGAEYHDDLVVDGPTVQKGTGGEDGYSAFTMADPASGETSSTGLTDLLQERDIERVVVVGLALDVCVKATALDSQSLGFTTTLVRDASAPVVEVDGERAVATLDKIGVAVA